MIEGDIEESNVAFEAALDEFLKVSYRFIGGYDILHHIPYILMVHRNKRKIKNTRN